MMEILKEENPILRQMSAPYSKEEIKSPETKEFLSNLALTLHETGAIGISAPQVGILKRLIIVNLNEYTQAMFNPVVIKRSGSLELTEGCLSFPGLFKKIKRASTIYVKYLDNNGKFRYVELSGWPARVVLHEIDHLNGKVFTEYE